MEGKKNNMIGYGTDHIHIKSICVNVFYEGNFVLLWEMPRCLLPFRIPQQPEPAPLVCLFL